MFICLCSLRLWSDTELFPTYMLIYFVSCSHYMPAGVMYAFSLLEHHLNLTICHRMTSSASLHSQRDGNHWRQGTRNSHPNLFRRFSIRELTRDCHLFRTQTPRWTQILQKTLNMNARNQVIHYSVLLDWYTHITD